MPSKDYNNYMNTYMQRRYAERMALAKKLLGGVCAICETTENLQIDHIDWVYKEVPVNKMWSIAKVRFLAELEKCQLLCAVHHTQKSKADNLEQLAIRGWKNQYGSGKMSL